MKRVILNFTIALCLLSGCYKFNGLSKNDMSTVSTEQLIQIIKDPKSDLFIYATEEIAQRGPDAAEAAPALAQALVYPRHDSDSAGFALVSMGEAAEPAIPYLIPILRNDRADVRAEASLVLGVIGAGSKCAIPKIAQLLWDKDPTVRGAAAITLDAITNEDLVPYWHKLNPSTPFSIAQDFPDGTLTKDARSWWEQEGQFLDWAENSKNCENTTNEIDNQ